MQSGPKLPNLRFLDLKRLKRQAPRGGEQSSEKRQYLGNGYDDIIDGATAKFGAAIFVCDNGNFNPIEFKYIFDGKDRYGRHGTITLKFRCQLRPHPKPRAKRDFILTVRVEDADGMINNWNEMHQRGAPAMATIDCGNTAFGVKERIREILTGWLDYFYFKYL